LIVCSFDLLNGEGRSIHLLSPNRGVYSTQIGAQRDRAVGKERIANRAPSLSPPGAIHASTTCRQSEEIFEISNGLLLHKK
jgi:hypothetical protein